MATTVPRTVVTLGEQKLTFIDEGQAFADIASTVVTLTLKTSYWDGTSETSRSVSRAVSVKSVEPGDDIAVDGDRKATVVLTVQPVGGGALASAQIPAGTSGSSSN